MASISYKKDSSLAMLLAAQERGWTLFYMEQRDLYQATGGVALARQEKPDAVLMAIVMPGLNGFQATRQLTKDAETSHIPVIIITTKDQETDKVWGTRQGAKDYLTKPVDEDTLIKTLNNVLAG
ncbi:response regulator [Pseudomonas chlororaphis]|uniref:response regulator n=1 Tax=Pseudomonas chlororaphis TaxID=587753 RepID=UPI0031F52419|nr:response regulator [Pseudomonas chlororaphis]